MRSIPLEALVVGSIFLEIPPLFLLYAIIKKSPEKMKFIRLFLLKMVVSEMLLTHTLLWGYWPDIFKSYYPLILLKVSSLFEYFGDLGGLLAFVAFLGSGSLSLAGVIEGCVMRFGITYNIYLLLKLSNGVPFVLFQLVEMIALMGIQMALIVPIVKGMPGLEQFVIEHGAYHLLDEFDVKRDVVTFVDPHSTMVRNIVLPFFSCALVLGPLLLCGLTYLTHRKIMKTAQLMSTDNYFLQKRLTYMILAQIVLPIVLIDVPLVITLFTLLPFTETYSYAQYEHTNLGFPIVWIAFTLYPLINTVATIAIIKPYRTAIFDLIPFGRRFRTRPLSYGIPNT